jgi:hypothetical protein
MAFFFFCSGSGLLHPFLLTVNKLEILDERKKFRILKPARAKAAAGGGQLPLLEFNRIIRSKNGPRKPNLIRLQEKQIADWTKKAKTKIIKAEIFLINDVINDQRN